MKRYKLGYIGLNRNHIAWYASLLYHNFLIECDIIDDCFNNECDLIFYSPYLESFNYNEYVSGFINRIQSKYKNVKFCLWHGEPHGFPGKDYYEECKDNTFIVIKQNSYSISHFDDNDTNCFYPYIIGEFAQIKNYSCCIKDFIQKQKTMFCSIISSTECIHRRKYINVLSKYKQVDIFGGINNVKLSEEELNNIMFKSKFNLAIENSKSIEHEHYITEKIMKSYVHGCIPIYFGSDYVYEFFNEQTFIDASKFSDNDLIEYIKEIDSNNSLYNEIIFSSFIKNNENIWDKYTYKMSLFIKNILEHNI